MAEFLQGVGFFALIGIILGFRIYRAEIIAPRRKAKRTGKDVHIQRADGLKTFRPDGSTIFQPYF
jgi:hypothetical protein